MTSLTPASHQTDASNDPLDGTVVAVTRASDCPGDESPFALGLLLHRAHHRASDALQGATRSVGLELRHFAVLMTLNREGARTQQELVNACGSEKTTMVRSLDYLEHHRLVVRGAHHSDPRAHTVTITSHGLATFDAAHAHAQAITATLTGHLEADEMDCLIGVLTKFTYPEHSETHGAHRYTPVAPHRS